MSILPIRHRDRYHDRFDCLACSVLFPADIPPRPQGFAVDNPDTRPKVWAVRGALDPAFDPCGAGPIGARSSSDEKESAA